MHDGVSGIVVDGSGNAYITGNTESPNLPVLKGPDLTPNGTATGYVAKVKSDGTGLDYCGYIGGQDFEDAGSGIAVDGRGNAYVTGFTKSSESTFPVIAGPCLTYNRSGDAFVAKVKSDGTGFAYCGYVGGSGRDHGTGIAVDNAGNAYITGSTQSAQDIFPVIGWPYLTYSGVRDAFVAKVKSDGTGLACCGYIGGSESEVGNGMAVDRAGNAYITGYTSSSESTFPISVGPYLTYKGGGDAFVAKVFTGFGFYGFDGPVDNQPVVNNAKAGSVIPVKWRIIDFDGAPISDPASFVSLTSYVVACDSLSGDPADEVKEYSAGSSGLQYLGMATGSSIGRR
jgi:hypothetical protein